AQKMEEVNKAILVSLGLREFRIWRGSLTRGHIR
ncbi:hypothetical protein HKBW3S25_00269, partial [Candidatus Hakubella thermalkaliphila]